MQITILFEGLPVKSSRGYLGWSTVALIKQSKLNVLFDTAGYNERATLITKLEQENLSPDMIDIVVLSHLHYDHAANFDLFPKASIVLSSAELEFAASPKGKMHHFIPAGIDESLQNHPKLRLVNNEQEIGKGLVIYHTPGHSPGGISLLVHSDRRFLFMGDAIKNAGQFYRGEPEVSEDQSYEKAVKETKSNIEFAINSADVIVPGHDSPFRWENDNIFYEGSSSIDIYTYFSPYTEQEAVITLKNNNVQC